MYVAICIAVFVVAYLLNLTTITVMYHRGLAHGGVTLKPWVKRFVALSGNWLTGLDPKGWVCMHRLHHAHSDTPDDPHSPVHKGFWRLMLWPGFIRKRLPKGRQALGHAASGRGDYRLKIFGGKRQCAAFGKPAKQAC